MADRKRVGKRPVTLEGKVDALSEAFEERFAAADARFDAVDARFDAVDARFDAVDARFEAVDARFDAVDARFEAVNARFEAVDAAFVEQREYTEFAFERLSSGIETLRGEMRGGFERVGSDFERLERKLDQFIDTQSRTNALVERRLSALEGDRDQG